MLSPSAYPVQSAHTAFTGHTLVLASGARPSVRAGLPVSAAGRAGVAGMSWTLSAIALAGLLAAALAAVAVAARWRRLQRFARRRQPPSGAVSKDYRAAGVLFYICDASGEVSHILLGVERRKVPLRDMNAGSGTAQRQVLLFPQGKVERVDKNCFDTAMREWIEETEDPAGLASLLQRSADGVGQPLPVDYYENAKMAITFCQVGEDGSTPPVVTSAKKTLQLRPVWVAVAELRHALASPSGSAELSTELGRFPLFPMTRRYLQISGVMKWMSMARPNRR